MNLEELGIPFTDMGENKEIELFWHISRSLVSKSNLPEILQLIVTMTAQVMGSKICSIMLYDEAKQELTIAASQALSEEYLTKPPIKMGESVSGLALKDRETMIVADVTKDSRFQFPEVARKNGLISLISVPMVVGDHPVGVINSYSREPHNFTDFEVKILRAVANQAAMAIENTKLREENVQTKRELEEHKTVARAKVLIMERDKLTESQAIAVMEKTSAEKKLPLTEVAGAVILAYSLLRK